MASFKNAVLLHLQKLLRSEFSELSVEKQTELTNAVNSLVGNVAQNTRQTNYQRPNNLQQNSRNVRGNYSRPPQRRTEYFVHPTRDDFCWYHKKFGIKAVKCTPPCAWRDESPPKNTTIYRGTERTSTSNLN